MTLASVRPAVRHRTLPVDASGSLWAALPACGLYDFHGHRIRIEVANPSEVLFPTDCGLSLLAALSGDVSVRFAGVRALDIGCGSGIYTVAMLADGAAHVTALDVNPASAAVTTANVVGNGLPAERLTCVTADLADYTPGARFDLVVTNPPHLPYDPRYATHDGLETALVAGDDGRRLYDLVIARLDDLLAPGGTLIMAHSSLTDIGRTVAELTARRYTATTLEICEMDIPLLAYAEHRDLVVGRLRRLRERGTATFDGERFTVHALAFQRPID